jgi:hypothetical protein
VVREATAALRPYTRLVPADLARELLADPERVDLRRAGYRLLRVRGPVERLRAALLTAADPEPRLAQWAVADATQLARDGAGLTWRRHRLPPLEATPDQLTELADLTDRAEDALGPETTTMLHAWLRKTDTH